MKRCCNCGEVKPKSDFYKDTRRNDGLRSDCKVCHNDRKRQYHITHQEERAAYQQQWYAEHRVEQAENKRQYYDLNRKDILEYKQRYRMAHREKVAERNREYRELHREKVAERNREWRELHREELAEKNRQWRAEHREYLTNCRRQWQRANPDKINASVNRRRALKAGNGGSYTPEEWLALCEACGNRCLCCGKEGKLTVDHVVPLVDGGANSIDNIQPLCKSCNSRKGTKTIDYRMEIRNGL